MHRPYVGRSAADELRDPFDRILIAQTIVAALVLVTADEMLALHKRAARTAEELELGDCTPLDEALGWIQK